MAAFRVGVQLHPQHCSIDELRGAWEGADALGVDSIWTWDHFYPLYGDDTGARFEGRSLLAAMAVTNFAHKNGVLDRWCEKLGRDPGEIERTVAIRGNEVDDVSAYLDAGATHLIVMTGHPFDLGPVETLLAKRA